MKKGKMSLVLGMVSLLLLSAGCGNDVKAEESTPESTVEQAVTELDLRNEVVAYSVGGTELDRGGNEDLYERMETLLQMRFDLINELNTGSPAVNYDQEISVESDGFEVPYYLVEGEGITGWDYYEQRAELVYDADYVASRITPVFWENDAQLYIEQDGQLYRAAADGVCFPIDLTSVKISQYSNDGYSVVGLVRYEMEDSLVVLDVRVNEDKPCGLEIVNECSLSVTTEMVPVK